MWGSVSLRQKKTKWPCIAADLVVDSGDVGIGLGVEQCVRHPADGLFDIRRNLLNVVLPEAISSMPLVQLLDLEDITQCAVC